MLNSAETVCEDQHPTWPNSWVYRKDSESPAGVFYRKGL